MNYTHITIQLYIFKQIGHCTDMSSGELKNLKFYGETNFQILSFYTLFDLN